MKPKYKKPPIGLIPKEFHEIQVKQSRFNDVCGAITRYYNEGLKINIEWIEEYNELVEYLTNNQPKQRT